jgi:hypothetical protein
MTYIRTYIDCVRHIIRHIFYASEELSQEHLSERTLHPWGGSPLHQIAPEGIAPDMLVRIRRWSFQPGRELFAVIHIIVKTQRTCRRLAQQSHEYLEGVLAVQVREEHVARLAPRSRVREPLAQQLAQEYVHTGAPAAVAVAAAVAAVASIVR